MKKKNIAMFGLSGLLVLSGCNVPDNANTPANSTLTSSSVSSSIDIYDLASALKNDLEYSAQLKEVDYNYITKYFSLNSTTDAVMFASDDTSEEVVVFKAADAVSAKNISDNIPSFIESQEDTFSSYSEEDASRLKNAVSYINGVYVVLCVSDNPVEAQSIIDDVFNGKKILEHVDHENSNQDNKTDNNTNDKPQDDNNDNKTDNTDDNNDNKSEDYPEIISNDQVTEYSAVTVIGNTGYTFTGYNDAAVKTYTTALNNLASTMAGQATVYNIPVLLSSGIIFPDNLSSYNKTADQKKSVQDIKSYLNDSVKTVDMYDVLMQHRNEYLYFRTDHHWTALGAYYAYTEFCKEKGIAPNELESFQTKIFEDFKGSYVTDTSDPNLTANPDTITAYLPKAVNTKMHVVEAGGKEFDWPIINDVNNYASSAKYSAFAAGDNSFTTIDNNDLTDGSACIVIKDSFGCAFMPFLVDHYQHIYEVDFRYWTGSLAQLAREKNATDIIFILNLCNTSNAFTAGKITGLCS